jgi:GNAT superfamily N-acetyltransferase
VGYAATGPCRDEGAEPGLAAEIYAIYFVKEAWGLGLGQTLMERILACYRELGFEAATLWVLERNTRARRFYEAGGWEPCGAPRTIWQDAIALREVQYRQNLGDLG